MSPADHSESSRLGESVQSTDSHELSANGSAPDTRKGVGQFTSTHWSVIVEAQGESPAAQEALEKLCYIYWRPIYSFVQRQGIAPEEAEDVTQAFFADLLQHNTSGSYNTAIGVDALRDNTAGTNDIAVGYQAGQGLTTGSNNIYIGGVAGGGNEGQSNTITIGGTQTTTYIAGISDTTLGVGHQVLVEVDGHLGVATCSRRFKENLHPMDKLSEALFLLNPVAFRYKKEIDPKGTRQLGLVAEEVEKVNPELVVHDKEGKPYTVRYDQVNAMLLNEFLKEHKKLQQLEVAVAQQRNDFDASIAELKKEIASVVARSKNQDARIQRVSAQVELNKPATQKIANK